MSQRYTVHIGNLALTTSEEKIREYFATFGEIVEYRPARTPTGQSRGFVFIDYASADSLAKAIAEGNNHELDGNNLVVEKARRAFGETSRRDPPRYDERRRRDDDHYYGDRSSRYDDYGGRGRYDDPPRRTRDPSPPYRRSRYDRDDYGSRRD
jgi:RNA recognition motif-containing protein